MLAWRGAFERNYQDGEYENSFVEIAGRSSYVNTDRTQARFELLATPFDNFSGLLIADYQPKGNEYLNGLTFHLPTPNTYAMERRSLRPTSRWANWRAAGSQARPVSRSKTTWPSGGSGQQRGDYHRNRGVALTLDYRLPFGDLKSISAYRNHYFSAANDDGTPSTSRMMVVTSRTTINSPRKSG